MQLRDYQKKLIECITCEWDKGLQNVIAQLATGGGKTILLASIIEQYISTNPAYKAIAIAHRTELLSQISLCLAQHKIYHELICPEKTKRIISKLHAQVLGEVYYLPNAPIYVAGIDTLIKKQDARYIDLFKSIGLVVQDEAHHVLKDNKWGKIATLFPNAKGLFLTATPLRADRKGLGRNAEGLADTIVTGPPMRALIQQGYLCDYRLICPPCDIDISKLSIGANGDYTLSTLDREIKHSTIIGDAVKTYKQFASNKTGLVFVPSVECAQTTLEAFQKEDIPCALLTGATDPLVRAHTMQQLRNRTILLIINVDICGEGVDVPAIDVVMMLRPTRSYTLYAQQFGRVLRPYADKPHAIIIDHVNNYLIHGLPDKPRVWSLQGSESTDNRSDRPLLRVCENPKCLAAYERIYKKCPYCYQPHSIIGRTQPAQVDGDLFELDLNILEALRAEIKRIDGPCYPPTNVTPQTVTAIIKRHIKRQEAQKELRETINQWMEEMRSQGLEDYQIYRKFYLENGIDVLTAQTLGAREACELKEKIAANYDVILEPQEEVIEPAVLESYNIFYRWLLTRYLSENGSIVTYKDLMQNAYQHHINPSVEIKYKVIALALKKKIISQTTTNKYIINKTIMPFYICASDELKIKKVKNLLFKALLSKKLPNPFRMTHMVNNYPSCKAASLKSILKYFIAINILKSEKKNIKFSNYNRDVTFYYYDPDYLTTLEGI